MTPHWTLTRRDLAPGPPVAQTCARCGLRYWRVNFALRRPDPCPQCASEDMAERMARERALCGVRG